MEELCKSIDTIAKDWKFWRQRSFDFTGTNVPEEKFSKEEEMKYLYNAYETAKNDKVIDTLNDRCDKATKEFEEYSNSNPSILIKLPYKEDIYDRFYVTFNRNNWYNHIQYWVPTDYTYHTCYSGSHKKNKEIIEKLQEYLPVKEIEQTVNFPFKCPFRSLS